MMLAFVACVPTRITCEREDDLDLISNGDYEDEPFMLPRLGQIGRVVPAIVQSLPWALRFRLSSPQNLYKMHMVKWTLCCDPTNKPPMRLQPLCTQMNLGTNFSLFNTLIIHTNTWIRRLNQSLGRAFEIPKTIHRKVARHKTKMARLMLIHPP